MGQCKEFRWMFSYQESKHWKTAGRKQLWSSLKVHSSLLLISYRPVAVIANPSLWTPCLCCSLHVFILVQLKSFWTLVLMAHARLLCESGICVLFPCWYLIKLLFCYSLILKMIFFNAYFIILKDISNTFWPTVPAGMVSLYIYNCSAVIFKPFKIASFQMFDLSDKFSFLKLLNSPFKIIENNVCELGREVFPTLESLKAIQFTGQYYIPVTHISNQD